MRLENIVISLLAPLQNAVIFIAVLWYLPVIWQRQLLCLGRRKQWHRYSIIRCNIGMITMGGDARVMYCLGMCLDWLYIIPLILKRMFCTNFINGILSGCLSICSWLSVWRMIPWINRISQVHLRILNKNITNVYRIDIKKNNWNIFLYLNAMLYLIWDYYLPPFLIDFFSSNMIMAHTVYVPSSVSSD